MRRRDQNVGELFNMTEQLTHTQCSRGKRVRESDVKPDAAVGSLGKITKVTRLAESYTIACVCVWLLGKAMVEK